MKGIVWILVIVVIVIVGYLAYSKGYFQGAAEEDGTMDAGLEVNIGDTSSN